MPHMRSIRSATCTVQHQHPATCGQLTKVQPASDTCIHPPPCRRAYSWQHDSTAHAQEALKQLAAAHTRVKQWNAQVAAARSGGSSSQGPLFTQRLNHFAHLSQEQFEQLLLPNKRRQPVERTKVRLWMSAAVDLGKVLTGLRGTWCVV